MKRLFAAALAIMVLCFAAPLALGSEMYDTYGNMDDWDEATWELSDSWGEEEWNDYWQGEEEAYRLQQEQELREARQALDLPEPEGVNVKLNDAYLIFDKSRPVYEEGRLYLPLREFFTACGIEAEISYDAPTATARVKLDDGRSLTIPVGGEELAAVDKNGQEYTIHSYDFPRLIDGVLYVEELDLCEFLQLDTRWDHYQQILYIIDGELLTAQLDENFSIYNRLFSIAGFNRDFEQVYRVSGNVAINAALYGNEKDDVIQAVLEYDGLAQGLNADITFKLKLDYEQMKDTLLYSADQQTMLLLKVLSSCQGRMIVNSGANGAVYVQSNLLTLADKRLGSKDWLKLGYYPYGSNFAEISKMMLDEFAGLSIGGLIYDSALSNSYYGANSRGDVYANALSQAKLWQALIGDANFKQESRGGYTTYSLEVDQTLLKQVIEDNDAYWPGSDIFGFVYSPYGYYYDEEEPQAISHTLNFREKDGRVTDVQANITAQTKGYLPVYYSADLEYQGNNLSLDLQMIGRYGGKINITANRQMVVVKDTPDFLPPAGSKIVTEEELGSQNLFLF